MEDEPGRVRDRLESGAWLITMAFNSSFFLWADNLVIAGKLSGVTTRSLDKPIGYPVDTRSLISPVC